MGLVDEIDGLRFMRSPLSQFNPDALAPAQQLGQDSADVLSEHLSLSPEAIEDLTASGIVQCAGAEQAAPASESGAAQASST